MMELTGTELGKMVGVNRTVRGGGWGSYVERESGVQFEAYQV